MSGVLLLIIWAVLWRIPDNMPTEVIMQKWQNLRLRVTDRPPNKDIRSVPNPRTFLRTSVDNHRTLSSQIAAEISLRTRILSPTRIADDLSSKWNKQLRGWVVIILKLWILLAIYGGTWVSVPDLSQSKKRRYEDNWLLWDWGRQYLSDMHDGVQIREGVEIEMPA